MENKTSPGLTEDEDSDSKSSVKKLCCTIQFFWIPRFGNIPSCKRKLPKKTFKKKKSNDQICKLKNRVMNLEKNLDHRVKCSCEEEKKETQNSSQNICYKKPELRSTFDVSEDSLPNRFISRERTPERLQRSPERPHNTFQRYPNISPGHQNISPRYQSNSPRPRSISPRPKSISPRPRSISPRPLSASPRPKSTSVELEPGKTSRKPLSPLEFPEDPQKLNEPLRSESLETEYPETPPQDQRESRKSSSLPRRKTSSENSLDFNAPSMPRPAIISSKLSDSSVTSYRPPNILSKSPRLSPNPSLPKLEEDTKTLQSDLETPMETKKAPPSRPTSPQQSSASPDKNENPKDENSSEPFMQRHRYYSSANYEKKEFNEKQPARNNRKSHAVLKFARESTGNKIEKPAIRKLKREEEQKMALVKYYDPVSESDIWVDAMCLTEAWKCQPPRPQYKPRPRSPKERADQSARLAEAKKRTDGQQRRQPNNQQPSPREKSVSFADESSSRGNYHVHTRNIAEETRERRVLGEASSTKRPVTNLFKQSVRPTHRYLPSSREDSLNRPVDVRDFVRFIATLSNNSVTSVGNKRKSINLYKDYLTGNVQHRRKHK